MAPVSVPQSHPVGTAGQHQVCADFSRIGWGAVPNAYEDFGIDVLLHARDRGIEKGLIVGAQVKSGRSYFARPFVQNGSVVGWYYYERHRRHLDYWLEHGVPQLIVLYDPDTLETFWVHITHHSVVLTGKGWKILVRRDARIDEASLPALLEVAASQRASAGLEGSVWSAPPVVPNRLWRVALIAPRLVVPHRNAGIAAPISPEQGAGMMLECRDPDFARFAQTFPSVPTLDESFSHGDWSWRFVGAIHAFVHEDEEVIGQLVHDAPTSAARVAAAIVYSCTLCRLDRHAEALHLLADCLEENNSPADTAWLRVHQARILVEIGEVEAARNSAMDAQHLLVGEPEDVTVSALASAASWLLWVTAASAAGNLAEVVQRGDTAVSWWRDQISSSGLGSFLDQTFKRWGESTAIEFSVQDPLIVALLTAMSLADLAADQGSFSIDRRLLARYLIQSRHGRATHIPHRSCSSGSHDGSR